MKWTKARLVWGSGSTDRVVFPLVNIPPTTKYIATSISGLGPSEIDIFLADRVDEGSSYQGQRPTNKQIEINVAYRPNYAIGEDVGSLRKALYAMLSPKGSTDLLFQLLNEDETELVEIRGRIKNIEPNIFTKDPETVIVMSCFTAYFNQPNYVHPSPATMGGKTTNVVINEGDVRTGFNYNIVLTAAASSLRFSITENGGPGMLLTYAFLANDRIIVSTVDGKKSIVRQRSGVADYNLIPTMSPGSIWPWLERGTNNLVVSTASYTVTSFSFLPKHWGF